MIFTQFLFIFIVFPLIYLVNLFLPSKYRINYLILVSILLYFWMEPVYCIFLLVLCLFVYKMSFIENKSSTFEIIGILLFILVYFKYYPFILSCIPFLNSHVNHFLLVPLAISFVTFNLISFVIDNTYHKLNAPKKLSYLLLYVFFFPKIIMGPLMSYHDFCSQIEKAKPETHHLDQIICRFIIGLTKKVVFANSLGIVFQTVMKNDSLSLITAWCALLAFTFQLYFDFSGYCDIAIALGKSLGFELSENFNLPYTAISIKDFWKRWHITLSQWFKNYVYIPLKGSRCSKRRAILNTSVVWILTGLWHGANWNYLLWGIYYFILLMLERYVFDEQLNKLSKRVRQGITFILVMFGWALFAFEDMGVLKEFILSLFGFNGFMDSMSLWIIKNYFILFVLSFVISRGILKKKDKYSVISMILLFLVDIAYMMNSTYQPFFYIQF